MTHSAICFDTVLPAAAQLPVLSAALPNARLWGGLPAQDGAVAESFAALHAAEGFAVQDVATAGQLRRLGWRGPIALLPGVADARALELCSRLGLWPAVACDAHIDWLAAHKSQQPLQVLLGAGAQGFAPARLRSAYARLSALPQVDGVILWAQAPDTATAAALAGQLDASSADWPGQRSLVVTLALDRAATLLPQLQALAARAERQGWDLEVVCTV